ncbi:hypothetical protein GCM10023349_40490 [Nocardioides conyzicola]|uniref:Fibronectin type-III domain-containing protein n=1 Tax=Nocardioides conyzicola TaxID=1651781 RepID=A0ABP8XW57_9ACTN
MLIGAPSTGGALQAVTTAAAATKTVGAPAARPTYTARPLSAAAAEAARADVALPRPVHGARAVRLLGDRVDEAAALNEMSSDELVRLLSSDPSAWVDSEGAVFYRDPVVRNAPTRRARAAAPLDQTFALHSLPGSAHTIFLDVDGASVSGTRWQAEHPGVPPTQPAWDPSGDGPAFADSELTSIQAIWASVAEDYAPFDVDVTTADPGAAAIDRSGPGDHVYGAHVVISPSLATSAAICDSDCGAASYLGAFGATSGGAGGDGYGYQQPAWVFPDLLGPDSPKRTAEAVSHEVGHQLGLVDDGGSTATVDPGHGAWAPIMGSADLHPISQWSQGDYPGATNHEDDVATIRSVIGSRPDDAGGNVGQAAAFPAGASYITSRSDVDVYRLGTCTGTFTVSASPVDAQADLDIKLTLLSPTGTALTTADPASAQTGATTASGLDASITQTNASGSYYVAVDGTGNGPWSTGYDDYGSLGAYTMARTGSCTGAAATGVPSQANNLAATPDPLAPDVALSWTAPTTPGAGGAVTGYLLTRSGSDDYVQVPASTTGYTWTGLAFGTGYTFTVTPLNANGPGVARSVTATTSSGTVVPGAPKNFTAAWNPVPQTAVLAWSAPPSAGSASVQTYALFIDGTLYTYYDASTTALGFAGLSPGATYTFGVAAVSSVGTGPTATATVTVPARAGNDAFGQRVTISGVSGSVTGNNTESSEESGEPAPTATRAGAGKASVWYSWTAPASGPVTLATTSSTTDRDTTLDVYTGSTVGTLSRVDGNDEPAGGGHLAAVTFNATAGTTYAIGVNGYRTATGVGPFGLTWAGSAIGAKSTTTTLSAVGGSDRSVKLTATVTATFGAPVGHVYFYDGSTQVGDDLLDGSTPTPTLTVTDQARGDHVFTAKFVPTRSDLFAESTSAGKTVTVAASTTATTLTGSSDAQQVTLTANVAPSAGTAAGTVQFRDGTTLVGTGTVAYGASTVVLTSVAPGAHSYTATFVPSDLERYVGSTSAAAAVTVAAYPAAASTTTTLSGQVSGRTARLVATVTATGATPAGSVQVKDGSTVVGSATLVAGSASLPLADLTRGTHQLTATFVPADATAYAASTSTATSLAVVATPTTTTLTPSLSGRTVTLQTSVSPSSAGTVELREGSTLLGTVTLSSGAGQQALTNVAVGVHHYTATFVPTDDLRDAGSTSPTQDVTIDPSVTSTALGSAVSGHQVTLTATVTSSIGAAAGSVTFREGDDVVGTGTVSGGVASTVLTAVSTGVHSYTATFAPTTPAQQAASVSPDQTATVAATTTTTDLTTGVSGQVVTLTSSVTGGTLAGKVEFREGSALVGTVPLASGAAVLQLPGVAPGAHAYVATFVPSGTTYATSSSVSRTANVVGATATTLASSVNVSAVTLTAGVTGPGTPAGDVEFRDGTSLVGTVTLSGGAASVTLPSVAAGAHSYTATFVPTSTALYAGSVSEAHPVDVARVASATTLTATVNAQSVDLSSTVSAASGALAGTVTFRDGGAVVATRTVTSTATTVTATVAASYGAHSYTATFVPTGTVHNPSTSPTRTATIPGTTTTTLTTDVTGRTVTATAVVAGSGATPAGSVAFYRDGTLVGTVTVASGTAVYTATSVVPGTYSYTATYTPGTAATGGSSSAASVATVDPVASTTTLQAAVSDRTVTLDSAVAVTSGTAAGKVQLRDGSTLVGVVTVASGAASLVLSNVTPGGHTYTATFVPADPTVYTGSDSDPKTVTAAKIATTTALVATVSAQTVTLTATPATAAGTLAGSVELRDGTTLLGTATLDATTVVRTFTDVTPGSHTYTATFVPTGTTHAGSTSAGKTVTAAERSSTTDLAAAVDVRTVTLDATVASGSRQPEGNAVFRDGSTVVGTVALDEGEAQLVLSSVTPGSHSYTATFVATDPTTYTGSASPSRTLSVLPIVTMTALTATSGTGQEVELSSQVTAASGVPSGNVVFREGGSVVATVAVVAGSALAELTGVVPGTHTYTATFAPTSPATFAGSASAGRSATVDPIATTTGLTATVTASAVQIAATLDSDAAGQVVFRQDGTTVGKVTLAGRAAALHLDDVTPGAHIYTATFVPTDPTTYAGSVSPDRGVTVKVPTVTDLTAGAVQRTVSLTATVVAAGSPAGAVEFREGSTLVGTVAVTSGSASVTLSNVTPGSHSYRATFVPTTPGTVAGSVSAIRSTTVGAVATTTVLDTDVAGRSVTFDVHVTSPSGSPAGEVDIRDGSTVVGTAVLVAGAASVTINGVAPGDHAYRAFFSPDDAVAYAFSSTAPSFTRIAPATTATDLDLSVAGRTVSFDAAVTSGYGTPAGSVILREGTRIVGTVDLVAGAAHLELTGTDPGAHTYTATYVPGRTATHVGSTSSERSVTVAMPTTTTLTSSASVRTVTLRSVVTPLRGTPAGSVVFREGSTVVDTVAVDSNGAATTSPAGVAPGEHTYTATFVPSDAVTQAGSVSTASKVTVAPIVTTTTLDTQVAVRAVTLSSTVTGASGTPTGQVEFRDGTGLVGTVAVTDGAASTTLSGVTPGEHTYTATFVPTAPVTYAGSVSTASTLTVAPIVTTTTLDTQVAVRAVTLSSTVTGASGAPTGQVEFREGATVVGTVAVSAGAASTTLTDVTPGAHTYTATYVPASAVTYAGSASSDAVATVAPIVTTTQLTTTADGRAVTLVGAVTGASGTPAGKVEFREGSTVVGTVDVASGAATTTLTNVSPGDHGYTATFVPTDSGTFAGSSSATTTVTIGRIATSTALVTTVTGQDVTLTATPSTTDGTLTGAVEFREGSTLLGTSPLSGTSAALTLTGVSAGPHTYTATFVPTGTSHATSSDHQTVTVPHATTTTLTATTGADNQVRLEALVTSGAGVPTGAVEFYDGTTSLGDPSGVGGDGIALLTVDDVLGGVHDYTAVFVAEHGDDFMTSSATHSLTVDPTTTETALVAERTPGSRSVVLTADVSAQAGNPAGTVTFRDGSTVVGTATVAAGEATKTLTSVPTGDHVYEATFVPTSSTTYAGSTSPQQSLTLATSTSATDVTVTSSGTTVTFAATVTSPDGVPTGEVQLSEGGAVVTSGVLDAGTVSVALPGVSKGEHTYVATYVPADDSFAGSASAARTVTVTGPVPGTATTTGLTAGAVRRTVSLKATVAASTGTPAGTVQFLQDASVVGSAPVTAGAASLTLPAVAAGAHAYTAVFLPADEAAFATSTSPARQVTVAPTATTTALSGKVSGTTATLRITVAGTDGLVPVGTVRVFDGSTRIGQVQAQGGKATLVVPGAAVRQHSYRATYLPSSTDFAGSSSSILTLTVRPVASTTTLTAPARAKAGSRPTLKVKVRRAGTPATGKVRLTYGATKVTLTLKHGQASYRLPRVTKGSLKVTAAYLGNDTTARSSATRSIKVG